MKLIITLLLFLSIIIVSGQPETKFFITGHIVDEQNTPIPYGNAALYNSDSTLVTGAVSDDQGKFTIEVINGNYYLKITFLSYQEKVIQNLSITQNIDLGKIVLKTSTELLSEVVVRGEKSQMELQLDKRVFNIGQDLANIGGNAAEILDNVPSVSVDVDGTVSLRGSQNVRILIDGKPSGLTGISSTDALRQLQGDMIESVEVITNPSSRFDAEGEVGIINIILKKNRRTGFNGAFTANLGYPANYGGSFILNYRKKNVNLFSSYGSNYRSGPGSGYSSNRFIYPDTTYIYEQSSTRTRSGLSHNFMIGADYFLTEKSTLTGSFLIRKSDGLNKTRFEFRDFDSNYNLVRTSIRSETEEEPEQNLEGALSYRKEFDRKGHTFTLDLKWIESDELELADFIETDDAGGVLLQRSSNTENERNILFQTDYIHPFSKNGKFETGLKSTTRILENDFMVEERDDEANWFTIPQFNNNFTFTERIHAVYAMAGNQFGKLSIQAGLRGEFSDITTELTETNESNNRTYFNLFPSTHLSYQLKPEKTLQLSYSYRISRPGFRDLLPFSSFSNNRSPFIGNPNLNPEYTHSIETGYLVNWESGSILSSAYYRHRTGVIQRITLIDSLFISRTIPVNLATEDAYGLEFNLTYSLQNWWRLNSSFNFYRAITEGRYQEQFLRSDTYTWTSRVTSKITFFKKWDFQKGINYRAPRITPQGKDLSIYSIDLGLSRDVFKGNGTITFAVRDLLNSRKRRSIIEQEDLQSESTFQWRARQFLLTFTYRLNQRKDRNSERNRNGEENNFGDEGAFD